MEVVNQIEVTEPDMLINGYACEHQDKSIVVIEVTATCETTAEQCDYCGLIFKTKTDCI